MYQQFGAKSQTVVDVHCDVGENQMSTKAVSQEHERKVMGSHLNRGSFA
jgi:hypothetical protein